MKSTLRTLAAGIAVLAALLVLPSAQAKETLRVLSWEGYTDPAIVAEFERQSGATVEISYVENDDELFERVSKNDTADIDVFAGNPAELQRYIDKGLVQPLTLANIPNRAAQQPRFRDPRAIPGLVRKGATYAVPYAYSDMGLIYNRKLVKEAPQSMAVMWDKKYRGRVLAYNAYQHNFSVVALLQGKDPFTMSDGDLEKAGRQLIELRRNVLSFYNTVEEATKLFRENEVALIYGNYGTQQVDDLRKAGADIGYVIPREGALAWVDCWAVTKGTRNKKLAEAWINYLIGKVPSENLSRAHGLGNTLTPPAASGTGKLYWLQPVESPDKRKRLWDQIMGGANELKL